MKAFIPLLALSVSTFAATDRCYPQRGSCNFECVSLKQPNTITVALRDCPAKTVNDWAKMAELDTVKTDTTRKVK